MSKGSGKSRRSMNKLLDLYKLANETKDKDAIMAFQRARDAAGAPRPFSRTHQVDRSVSNFCYPLFRKTPSFTAGI